MTVRPTYIGSGLIDPTTIGSASPWTLARYTLSSAGYTGLAYIDDATGATTVRSSRFTGPSVYASAPEAYAAARGHQTAKLSPLTARAAIPLALAALAALAALGGRRS